MIGKLKNEKIIERLFKEGETLFVYPIKIVYQETTNDAMRPGMYVGVSVSKRNFKLAVDRNKIKRQLRESIRNCVKGEMLKSETCLMVMAIYVSKDKLNYDVIHKSIGRVFKKLANNISF